MVQDYRTGRGSVGDGIGCVVHQHRRKPVTYPSDAIQINSPGNHACNNSLNRTPALRLLRPSARDIWPHELLYLLDDVAVRALGSEGCDQLREKEAKLASTELNIETATVVNAVVAY